VPDITWTNPFFPTLLYPSVVPLDSRTFLDVGCGKGVMGCLLRIYREPKRIVGVDVFNPYLEFVRKMGMYDSVLRLDVSESQLPFERNEFDIVFCLEVIEHLEKDRGLRLLQELERVGRRVIVSTPGSFAAQAHFDGNVNQEHKSQYTVKDFEGRGYRVVGVGTFQVLGRDIRPISSHLGSLTFRFPRLSGTILAIKDSRA